MLTKEKIQEMLNTFPSNKEIDVDELIQKIFILKDLEESEKDINDGIVFSQEDVLKKIASWQK